MTDNKQGPHTKKSKLYMNTWDRARTKQYKLSSQFQCPIYCMPDEMHTLLWHQSCYTPNLWSYTSLCYKTKESQQCIFLILQNIYKTSKKQVTKGLVLSAKESPRCLRKAFLFSAFPSRSLALYWNLRKLSVAGFQESVSIPFRIPTNFWAWALRVAWSPCPPCMIKDKLLNLSLIRMTNILRITVYWMQ